MILVISGKNDSFLYSCTYSLVYLHYHYRMKSAIQRLPSMKSGIVEDLIKISLDSLSKVYHESLANHREPFTDKSNMFSHLTFKTLYDPVHFYNANLNGPQKEAVVYALNARH